MEAIRLENNALYLLDQTRLPAEERWLRYTEYRAVARAIRSMVVRGAPAIGVAAAVYGVLVVALRAISRDDLSLMPKGDKIARLLHL